MIYHNILLKHWPLCKHRSVAALLFTDSLAVSNCPLSLQVGLEL